MREEKQWGFFQPFGPQFLWPEIRVLLSQRFRCMFNHQCPHHRNVWECQTGLISKSGFLPKSACYHYFSGSSGSGSMHSLGFLVRFSGRYKVVCAYSIRWNQNQPKLFPMIISIWDKLSNRKFISTKEEYWLEVSYSSLFQSHFASIFY